jgi:hypothetical protein
LGELVTLVRLPTNIANCRSIVYQARGTVEK